ncbi:MAG TPA: DUF3576 domain-containing protein [Geminicoccaceae bacterium]|nr:DUF3576 domain-containing protein [Geminicoccaceae bacterium]
MRRNPIAILGLAAAALAACTSDVSWEVPEEVKNEQTERIRAQHGTIHGQEGILAFGTGDSEQTDGAVYSGIGVNAYLWRASLETIDFMPLTQADPFGGVIITDWYSPPETPGERFKINVYILDTVLRADGVKVAVFRQINGTEAGWVDAAVDTGTATAIEDNILTRARELRIAAINTQ